MNKEILNMKRVMLNILIILVISFSLTVGAFAQSTDASTQRAAESETVSYIVVMKQNPVIAYEGDEAGLQATKPGKGGKINPNSAHVKKYQDHLEASHNASLAKAGADVDAKVYDYTVALNGYSAILTAEEAKDIAAQSAVVLVLPDEMRYLDTDSSPTFLGLTDPAGPWQTGYDGEGVLVGVIDSGIWPEHASFADDGSFPAAPVLDDSRPNCEFGNTTHNENDVPFECNNKLVGARQMLDTYRALIGAAPDEYDSARDDNGHGTHTASTAAGNAGVAASMYGIPRGTISGIAPRAQVVAYKGLGNLGGFTSDLAAAIDQAVADGVDVINYSVGGGAAGPGADEISFLFAADVGIFVATSAGNSGPNPATLGNPGTMPWMTTVGASTQSRFWQGTAVLGDGSEFAGASITPGAASAALVDAEDAGGDLCVPGTLDPAKVAGNIVLCRRGAIARAAKSLAVMQAGGAGTILYNNSDVDNLFSDSHWTPAVHIDNTPGLAIKVYIDSAGSAATAEIVGEQISEWATAPSMTIFSSRGPNPVSPDLIKPDITAPGLQILAGYSPTPNPGSTPPGEYFGAIAGTSMSSPEIAGVFALIKQAHPDWSAAIAKSAIMTTAYQEVVDNDRVSQADPFDMGAGHVDPGNAVHKGSAFQPGLAYDAGLFEYAAYTCGEDFGVFTPGSCDFLESIGVPSEPFNLNLPSIGVANLPGSQTVVRTVTSVAQENGWRDYSVSVDEPPGFDVTVSPSSFSLKSGDTATYEVTITNVSSPVGAWAFGALTWSDATGNYDVYSPIAVKAALFYAPSEVTGSGESGSTSFDVSFGYTGSYAAAPHGLVADNPTSGNIGQDPDQTYPSADDSPIGVQKITYPISGAAFVRWEMVIPGPDDIDLFLEDSSGTRIAASTNGGTDELIELTLPADDTYALVIHGWSVPNAPLPYTMHYWEVPLASSGSLSVDAAPASATIGETSTIDVSWSGLAASTHYLGAVSHTGDTGLMGFTLVDVAVP
jgi:subtilisin family serine protease